MTEKIINITSVPYNRFRVSLINPTRPYDKKRNNAYYLYDYVETKTPGIRLTEHYAWNGEFASSQKSDYMDLYPWYGRSFSVTDVRFSNKPVSHPYYIETDNEAISQLIARVQQAKGSSFNAAVAFAEGDKVLRTISVAATRVFAFYKAIRKGNLGDAYSALGITQHQSKLTHRLLLDEFRRGITSKTSRIKVGAHRYPRPKTVRDNVANYVLETKYGWMPLLSDVKSACEKIAKLVVDTPIPLKIRARANGNSDSASNGYLTDPPETSASWYLFNKDKVRIQYTLRYAFTSEYLAQAASLGLTNPASVIWETVPYSFIIDWFIPVGKYLESLSAFTGLNFQSCVVSAVRECESRYSHTGQPVEEVFAYWFPQGIPTQYVKRRVSSTGGVYRYKFHSFLRSVLDDFPSPRLSMSSQEFTWGRAAVVAALLQRGTSNKRTHALSPLL